MKTVSYVERVKVFTFGSANTYKHKKKTGDLPSLHFIKLYIRLFRSTM